MAKPRRRPEPASVALTLPPLTAPQIEILGLDETGDRCIDIEGAPRSAKSWGVVVWIWKLVWRYPGIQIFYARYMAEGLGHLRDLWSKISVFFPAYLQPQWNAAESSWDFADGSRVVLSAIKSSEIESLHSKYKGRTIAVVIIEEAQEVPRANYLGLRERLSQSRTPAGEPYDYPLQIVLVHNAVDEDHWIAQEFPLVGDTDACATPGHRHIRADLYSNAQNLGPAVMAGYEQDYPIGHVLRRTAIDGRRGVTLTGKPVYEGYFDRVIHLTAGLEPNPYYPLVEGWDFGHEKPAVVWFQYLRHIGAIQVLGAVKGSNLFIEHFAPKVLEIRKRWFPLVKPTHINSWCDPAGATTTSGTIHTGVATLRDLGVGANYIQKANDVEVRFAAIEVIAGFMLRVAGDGSPAFQVTPRCVEVVRHGRDLEEHPSHLLVTALEAGYIWDEHALSDAHPNVRKPKKGTRYDDLMNALEYGITGEDIHVPQMAEMLRAEQRLALRARKELARLHERRDQAQPTGETLLEAHKRIAKENAGYRDRDDADAILGRRFRRREPTGQAGPRGGYR